MTFPTVTLPSSPDRPSQHKKNTCWGPWNARIHQSLWDGPHGWLLSRGAMSNIRGVRVDSDLEQGCFCVLYMLGCYVGCRMFDNDPDDLIPSLTDGETEAQREDGTCLVAG